MVPYIIGHSSSLFSLPLVTESILCLYIFTTSQYNSYDKQSYIILYHSDKLYQTGLMSACMLASNHDMTVISVHQQKIERHIMHALYNIMYSIVPSINHAVSCTYTLIAVY